MVFVIKNTFWLLKMFFILCYSFKLQYYEHKKVNLKSLLNSNNKFYFYVNHELI